MVLVDDGPEPGGRLLAEGGASARVRSPTPARAAGVEILDQRPRARLLRRARARLAGRHAAPDPRAAPHLRHRRDRAAAGIRGQRPARRDAVRRRAPAGRAVRGHSPGTARGRGHDSRPRARRRARAARGRRARSPPSPTCATRRPASSAPRCSAPASELLQGMTVVEAQGRSEVTGAVLARVGRPARRAQTIECDLLVVSGGTAPATSLLAAGRRARPRYDARPSHFALAELPDGRPRGGRGRRAEGAEPPRRSGTLAGLEAAARARASATRTPRAALDGERERQSPARRRSRRSPSRRPSRAAPRRQVLRLPLRGRHRQGHRPTRRRGLRLDRALQALHDRDDGPLPGPHVPARLDPADGQGDGRERWTTSARRPRARPWSTVPMGALAGPPVRAGQALADPRPPPRAGRAT